ncbi:type I glutamine synthetase [Zymomonas mobilis subsp. mobilis ZM4 = ATCC 31821]|uniref:Glutamine synthetase n=3 Tax=Zymomonas TaxID=541 RepID=Q5NQ88_ZYMMO|nr:type I glutamate--ammonia ligase [Zymomonas mobilis]AAV89117.1 glutamine synthetase, type I [Zymomonas mobilis subsp. mobilis ZM4 = ATCC 31821]ACV75308.1 glutamine synthetase, type I [Zymomonas mobilis subsp. mobilis NCIMB 11163]AEH62853.1 glutamine synthetase, type I [Zymomonas mobilis subsp. mobilis ATCC 10988]AHB10094.1 L-glutamine synthetase [Zymomonas mobilis subsp. mobilis str. CP4 = NRRL B-14023]AHJ70400.1 Glutamine synthetase [Zymomonas mobilis subsp. mobilis NRRL B-12526]
MANSASDLLKLIKEKEIDWVDLRFTDPKGKWQHLTMASTVVGEDDLNDGFMFDGSSIEGWKTINESDMILKPDLDAFYIDPFSASPMLILICDIVEPATGEFYSRDPRSTAKRAEAYVKTLGLGDTVYIGPEAEFFLFDDVRFDSGYNGSFYRVDDIELPTNSGREYDNGNLAHRPGVKGGYFPVAPVDSAVDIRSEMVSTMLEMGLPMDKHHHEVAPAQHELGLTFGTLTQTADRMQVYKYVVHQIAQAYGKTATFMPKPISGDNGSGMHTHISIWDGGKPTFAGSEYAGLSENALYFIGGIIRHAKAINGLTNPSTNSYKRLVPGFEAPVLLAYSARNRSASCRIPYGTGEKSRRVEIRFPDATANPYLCYTALLMAGIDGIQNKIHPGEAMDCNLYDLPPEELAKVPTVAGSLREALDALSEDFDFLTKGDVFTEDQIKSYIEIKRAEVLRWEMAPSPVEFEMYYSL